MFDYGTKNNLLIYQQETPPKYEVDNLKTLKIPIYLFVGQKDVICDEIDI
jgi:surfactin synthase thioesterase subunit